MHRYPPKVHMMLKHRRCYSATTGVRLEGGKPTARTMRVVSKRTFFYGFACTKKYFGFSDYRKLVLSNKSIFIFAIYILVDATLYVFGWW